MKLQGHCIHCGATERLDVYNDFGDHPGDLICDPCIYAAATKCEASALPIYAPAKPEGYYHCAPGTFD